MPYSMYSSSSMITSYGGTLQKQQIHPHGIFVAPILERNPGMSQLKHISKECLWASHGIDIVKTPVVFRWRYIFFLRSKLQIFIAVIVHSLMRSSITNRIHHSGVRFFWSGPDSKKGQVQYAWDFFWTLTSTGGTRRFHGIRNLCTGPSFLPFNDPAWRFCNEFCLSSTKVFRIATTLFIPEIPIVFL